MVTPRGAGLIGVDFSLQDIDGTLAEAVETWQAKAEGKARMDYGLHVAITNLTDAVMRVAGEALGRLSCM